MKRFECKYCGNTTDVLLTHMVCGGGLIYMCKKCYLDYLMPFYEPTTGEVDHEEV